LEQLNDLYSIGGKDSEDNAKILAEISVLEEKNKQFYLFDELARIKSKYFSFKHLYDRMVADFYLDLELSDFDFNQRFLAYKKHLETTKTFDDYMCCIEAYNFKQNMIDLYVVTELYKEQHIVLEIIIDTFSFKRFGIDHFSKRLKEITLFDTTDFIDVKENNYGKILISMVKKLRSLFFKIKLIINFPIMTSDRYLIMDSDFNRLAHNSSNGLWYVQAENDLFLLNKKLELRYGYEIGKVEEENHFTPLVSESVKLEKSFFGTGLSTQDIKNLSIYIQHIESLAIAEYDNFFMFPLWLDYLEKNT
jgi:virulence-associated protein VapD